jgi:hypothetical protein
VEKMLLEKGSRVNATYAAAYAGHTENLQLLIASDSTHLQHRCGGLRLATRLPQQEHSSISTTSTLKELTILGESHSG